MLVDSIDESKKKNDVPRWKRIRKLPNRLTQSNHLTRHVAVQQPMKEASFDHGQKHNPQELLNKESLMNVEIKDCQQRANLALKPKFTVMVTVLILLCMVIIHGNSTLHCESGDTCGNCCSNMEILVQMMDISVDTICTNVNDTNYDYELMDDVILNLDIFCAHDLSTPNKIL